MDNFATGERQRTTTDSLDSQPPLRSTGARSLPRASDPSRAIAGAAAALTEDELIAAHRNEVPDVEDDYPASAWLSDGAGASSAAVRTFRDKMQAAGLDEQLRLAWEDHPPTSPYRR